MIQIVPAILALDEESFRRDLKRIEESRSLEDGWIHIDLMDGQFVDRTSVGPEILEKYPPNGKVEAHLMVKDPLSMFDELKIGGAKRVIIHLEVGNTGQIISQAKSEGFEVGVAINPESEVSELETFLEDLDAVLVMGVHPGAQGQDFIDETPQRVKQVTSLRDQKGLHFLVGADGGVSDQVAGEFAQTGVDYLVVGSHLLKGDISENLEKIKASLG